MRGMSSLKESMQRKQKIHAESPRRTPPRIHKLWRRSGEGTAKKIFKKVKLITAWSLESLKFPFALSLRLCGFACGFFVFGLQHPIYVLLTLAFFILQAGFPAFAQIATTNNPHGKIKNACSDCHTTKGWSPLRLDINFKHDQTGFALAGQHAVVQCKDCHASLKFTGSAKDCKSCHTDVHDGTLGQNCERCHTPQAWQDVSKITAVHQESRFPLIGRHQHIGCDDCHTTQGTTQFINMPLQCGACHLAEYEATTAPNHKLIGFSLRCETCHSSTITGWESSQFAHPASFPLALGHANLACEACHTTTYQGTSTACFSCHQGEYQSAKNPNHLASNFPRECQTCHSTSTWQRATIDHNRTRFQLTGAHSAVTCEQCHVNNQFTGTPTDCFSCHQSDFQQTTNPNHVASNYPNTCLTCHSTSTWQGATFDHNRTRFQLTGAHAAVTCEQCHVNNQFTGTPTNCFSCHQNDFQQTTNPNHAASNFPNTCLTCHSTSTWQGATLNHNTSRFPLTGAHLAVACDQCHVNNQYTGTPTDCFSCHQSDFQQATSPNHVAGNFSQTCTNCHTSSAWQPSTFNHISTQFPLLGAHTTVSCGQCHINDRYAGTPMDCYSCHQDDFQRPTSPNHVTLNFSQNCTTCHTMTAWQPATFDHDAQYFRIYSGKHRGEWQSCATCHVNPNDYKVFECILCHEHNQTKMDDTHRERQDYQFNSAACYNCHPNV